MTKPFRLTKAMRRDFCDNADSGVYKPAMAFEARHDLSGIAGYYALPDGHNPRSFEQHVRAYAGLVEHCFETISVGDRFEVVRQVSPLLPTIDRAAADDWANLLALNPQLSAVEFDQTHPLLRHHVLMGVASMLNPDDINFLMQLSVCDAGHVVSEMPDFVAGWTDAFNRVSSKAAGSPQWSPSFKTLQKIDALLPDL